MSKPSPRYDALRAMRESEYDRAMRDEVKAQQIKKSLRVAQETNYQRAETAYEQAKKRHERELKKSRRKK